MPERVADALIEHLVSTCEVTPRPFSGYGNANLLDVGRYVPQKSAGRGLVYFNYIVLVLCILLLTTAWALILYVESG